MSSTNTFHIIRTLFIFLAFTDITGCSTARPSSFSQNQRTPNRQTCSRWNQKVLTDIQEHQVIVFKCESSKKELEAVVFSLNRYGDHTIADYRSLKEFGTGRIAGSAIAAATLPDWARSSFSSEPDEVKKNERFRQFLIDQKILTTQHTLSAIYSRTPASLVFSFTDMRQEAEATELHENSHVFYNNVDNYRTAAYRVYAALKPNQRDCVQKFIGQRSMYADSQDVIVDEFIAYYVEEQQKLGLCFGSFGPDFNKDGVVTPDERYLWDTHHPGAHDN